MIEPIILSESEMKEIEELLNDNNLRVNWKEGALESYFYTKEILLAKKREEEEKEKRKEIAIDIIGIVCFIIIFYIIGFLSNI